MTHCGLSGKGSSNKGGHTDSGGLHASRRGQSGHAWMEQGGRTLASLESSVFTHVFSSGHENGFKWRCFGSGWIWFEMLLLLTNVVDKVALCARERKVNGTFVRNVFFFFLKKNKKKPQQQRKTLWWKSKEGRREETLWSAAEGERNQITVVKSPWHKDTEQTKSSAL